MVEAKKTPEERLAEIARTVSRQEPDAEKAAEIVLRAVDRAKALRQALLRPMMRTAVYKAVEDARYQRRRTLTNICTRGLDSLSAAAEAARNTILDTYMVGKKCLGDCTRDDLAESTEGHKAAIGGRMRRIAFESAVAKTLKTRTITVRRKHTADSLTAILITIHAPEGDGHSRCDAHTADARISGAVGA